VTGGTKGIDYSFYNNTLWLTPNEPLEISMAPGVSNTAARIMEDTSSGSKNITVTLNGIHISGDGSMFSLGSGTNTVVLRGNSDIENTQGGTQGVFYSDGPLTIKGTGSLTLTDSTSDVSAVQCGDALQIGTDTDTPHITVTNTKGNCINGGNSNSSISISGGKVDCSGVYAIKSDSSVSISGGMINLTSKYSEIQGNTVSITGGLFSSGDPAGVINEMPRGRITSDKTPDAGYYVFSNTDVATKDTYRVRVAEGFMITLDQQEATVSGTTSVPAEKGSLILPDIQYLPSKTNYDFGGYFAEPDGKGKQYYNANGTQAGNNDLTQDTTLYAYWIERTLPVFTTQPLDQEVDKGDTATFTVAASGNPAPDFYQWEYKLPGRDWQLVVEGAVLNDTTYTTPKTSSGIDGCLYRCRAHNSVGSTYSEPAKLSIRMAIHLDTGTDYTFRSEEEGYTYPEVLTENVINDGGRSTGKLQISLSGQDSSAFELSTTEIGDISLGGRRDFSVQPKSGLSAGTYTAAVTVSGTGIPDRSFNVSFTVSTAYTITLDQHEITMETGDSRNLNATVAPSSAASLQIVWEYTNDKIAAVDDNGNVKAIAEGEAEIAAMLFDNNVRKAMDTCKVTVTKSVIAPAITDKDIPSGTTGKEYSATLKANGTTPFTWSLESGSLPDGLNLDSSTGVISGTPTVSGTLSFTVKVSNTAGSSTADLKITIADAGEKPSISVNDIPFGIQGKEYSATLKADGTMPFTWSVESGCLPDGLNLDSSTGVISGTPSVLGTFSFMVKVANSAGSNTADLKIIIDKYEILEGSGQSNIKTEGKDASFRSNAPYNKFEGVKVDNNDVSKENYTTHEGSTIVTLKASYLATLPIGPHTLTVVSNDGEASAPFYVTVNKTDTAPVSSGSGCSHPNIAWETVKEATSTEDGEMEYRCPDCGYVEQRLPISGYTAFIADACKTVKNAKTGATVKITTDRWMSFHHSVIDQLQKRSDVGMDLLYRYDGKNYEILIPAGTDLSGLIDKNGYIGFLQLASKFGTALIAE
jgi:uncharacterized protein YjdB